MRYSITDNETEMELHFNHKGDDKIVSIEMLNGNYFVIAKQEVSDLIGVLLHIQSKMNR